MEALGDFMVSFLLVYGTFSLIYDVTLGWRWRR